MNKDAVAMKLASISLHRVAMSPRSYTLPFKPCMLSTLEYIHTPYPPPRNPQLPLPLLA